MLGVHLAHRKSTAILTVERCDVIFFPVSPAETYKLSELCDLAGVTTRTVHYYIQQGLLPPAASLGSKASYDRGHLLRLQLIRRLQKEHLPLAVIRERLAGITDEAVEQLGLQPEEATEEGNAPALDYIRRVLGGSRRPDALPHLPTAATDSSSSEDNPTHSVAAARQLSWDRSQWDRIALTPDVELHIRRPLSREQNRQVERLIDEARDIFKEE